jgi:UDP-N-acetylmuramoylalanine--D-glutamate ligase
MTVAKLYGVGNAAIAHVLATFGGVKHRIQFLKELNGRRIYNDSKATNVEAASVAIEAFKAPEVLIAGGLDRHLSMDALIPLLKEHVHALVTYGETSAQMVEVAQKAGIADIKRVDNLDQAVPAAYALSNPGDVLLLSPAAASWDQFHTFEERGDRFIADVDKLQ